LLYIYSVHTMVQRIKKQFSSTLNLVRTELFFGACFGQFYSLFFLALTDIEYSQSIVNLYSFLFLIVLLFSFIKPDNLKAYRIVSNTLYLLASIYILFVAFINDYDRSAFFLVIFNYSVVSFSMPNLKILGVVSAFFYWTFIMSYFLLDFDAETPFFVALLSLLFISASSFFIVFARNVYKNRIKERELLLSHVFNTTTDGLLLVNQKNYKIEDCNISIEKMFKISKKDIIGKDILNMEIKNKKPFEHVNVFSKETIELESKEVIHYQKKEMNYMNYSYLLIQVKKFKNKIDMNSIFRLSKR